MAKLATVTVRQRQGASCLFDAELDAMSRERLVC